jgi:hypothetical protein
VVDWPEADALLQSYTMEITYRSGKLHSNADALSRRAYSVKENGVDKGMESTQAVKVSVLNDNDKKSKQANSCETFNQTLTTSISLQEISKHQKSDPKIRPIYNYICHGKIPKGKEREILPKQNQYFVYKDVLYHVYTQKKVEALDDFPVQLVIPRPLVPLILKETHDSHLSEGHMGIARTIAKTKVKYFWEGMYRDIVNWVNSC